MKTKHSIQIAFGEVKTQAENLQNCAEDLRQVQRQLEQIKQSLSAGWQGNGASRFIGKCEQLEEKIKKSACNVEKISEVIRTTAKGYYDAELRALEIAQQRKVH